MDEALTTTALALMYIGIGYFWCSIYLLEMKWKEKTLDMISYDWCILLVLLWPVVVPCMALCKSIKLLHRLILGIK